MVARSLDRLKGQKQIILLSEGFDARLVRGREEIGFEKTREEADATFSGEVWKIDQEQRFGSSAASTDVRQMADIFRRSDVVLHAMDIKGLRSGVDASAGVKKTSNESLFLLTTPTGGTGLQATLDWLGETEMGTAIETATAEVVKEGKVRTYDMGGSNSTLEMGEAIAAKL